MGGTAFSNNTTIKVAAKRAAGYVVGAGEYVIATYAGGNSSGGFIPHFQVYFAPGDTVASSYANGAITSALVTAVGFINSP